LRAGSLLTVQGSLNAAYLGPIDGQEYASLHLVNGVSSFGHANDSFISGVDITVLNSELYITGSDNSQYLFVDSDIELTNSTFYGNNITLGGLLTGSGTLIADDVSIQNGASLALLIVTDSSVLSVNNSLNSPAVFSNCQLGAGSVYVNGIFICNSSNVNVNLEDLQLVGGIFHLTFASTLSVPQAVVYNSSIIVARQFYTPSVIIGDVHSYLTVYGDLNLVNSTIEIPLYPPGDFNQSVFTVEQGDALVQGAKITWPQFNDTSVHPKGKVSLIKAVSGSISGDVELTFPNVTGLRVPKVYYNYNASEIVLDFSDYPDSGPEEKHLPVWVWVLIAVGGFAVSAVIAFFAIRHIRRRSGYEEVAVAK